MHNIISVVPHLEKLKIKFHALTHMTEKSVTQPVGVFHCLKCSSSSQSVKINAN